MNFWEKLIMLRKKEILANKLYENITNSGYETRFSHVTIIQALELLIDYYRSKLNDEGS